MIEPELYKQIFEDDRRGAAILEELTVKFARPAVTTGGIDAILQTYVRDGQRRVIEYIVNRINRANGVHTEDGD
ncbi:Bbp19 family protein [Burkholderia cenocepacia]